MKNKKHTPVPASAEKHGDKKHADKKVESAFSVNKVLPHVVAILVFVVITFLYFSPEIMGGKVPNQSDIAQGRGASKEIADFRKEFGTEPLWTNSMFGGMPAFQISATYYGNLTRFVGDILTLGFPHPSQLLFIALLGFYLLLIALDVNPWLSIAGAIGFALSSYDLIILNVGHNSKMAAMGFMPMVLAGALLIFYRRKYLLGTAISAVAISLEVKANHLQISYYLFLVLLIFGITQLIDTILKKDWRHFFLSTGLLIACAVLGICSNLSLLWSTSEYADETIRGKSELTSNTESKGGLDEDYAFGWSYGKMETFTFLIPDFMGGSAQEKMEKSTALKAIQDNSRSQEEGYNYLRAASMYWGDQPFTAGPIYLGALVCFLFVLGMLLLRGSMKWWLFSASLLAVFLSWGHNFLGFTNLFFEYFPLYNKFRTVTMILVVPQLCFPLLGIVTLSKIINGEFEWKEVIAKLKIATYITGGLCLFFIVLGGTVLTYHNRVDSQLPDWLSNALVNDRESLLRTDALRSLAFILGGAILIWLFCTQKIKSPILIAGIVLLVFVDLFPVGKRYLNDNDFQTRSDVDAEFSPSAADQQIMQDNSLDYRVFKRAPSNNMDPFNDSRTSYFHKSIGGYSAAKLRRYQELIENQLSKGNMSVFDMLNTKYFILPDEKQQNDVPQPNPGALGNAWFTDSVIIVANADEEMNRIGDMYEMKLLDGGQFSVNGKMVSTAMIGNHDVVKVDTVVFEVAAFPQLRLGMTDTFGIATRVNKQNGTAQGDITLKAQGGTEKPFTVHHFYEFNPRRNAIIDKRFENYMQGFTPRRDSARSIKLLSYEPNDLVYESKASKEGLVVFSEIYYDKGWKAYLDGNEVPYVRADYVLRAMRVPAGQHKIEFKFEPKSYFIGEKVAYVSSALILLLFVGVIGMSVSTAMKKKEE